MLCAVGLLTGMRPPSAEADHAASAHVPAPARATRPPSPRRAQRPCGPGRTDVDARRDDDRTRPRAAPPDRRQAHVRNHDLRRGRRVALAGGRRRRPGARPALLLPKGRDVQIKAIADPAADWDNRLIAEFDHDVSLLHATLGADAARATFVDLAVPGDQAQWIVPGVEYNSGSYWRVYGSTLRYRLDDGSLHELPVTSLISWRGEWYVVHLGPIR